MSHFPLHVKAASLEKVEINGTAGCNYLRSRDAPVACCIIKNEGAIAFANNLWIHSAQWGFLKIRRGLISISLSPLTEATHARNERSGLFSEERRYV